MKRPTAHRVLSCFLTALPLCAADFTITQHGILSLDSVYAPETGTIVQAKPDGLGVEYLIRFPTNESYVQRISWNGGGAKTLVGLPIVPNDRFALQFHLLSAPPGTNLHIGAMVNQTFAPYAYSPQILNSTTTTRVQGTSTGSTNTSVLGFTAYLVPGNNPNWPANGYVRLRVSPAPFTRTIGPNAPPLPEVSSLFPISGSGSAPSPFVVRFRHTGGVNQFYLGYMLFLPLPNIVSFNAAGTCLVEFNRLGGNFDGKGGLRLINNAGNDWLGRVSGEPIAPGTPPLNNNACTVNVAGTTANIVGTDVVIGLPVTFNAAGVTNVMGTFLQSADVKDKWTDFRQFGNWAVAGAPPKPGPFVNSVSPASGTGATTFTVSAGHTSGWSNLDSVHVRLDTAMVANNPCHVIHFVAANTIALVDDAGQTLVGPAPVGTALSTGRCNLGAGSTRLSSGNLLTLSLPMTFNAAAFGAGTKNVYVNAFDITGGVSHWVLSATRAVN